MKRKICIISVVILLAVLCWLPLPRRVACQSEAIQISGWYLDFLLIGDRFYGNTQINGNDLDMRTIYLKEDLRTIRF